MAMSTNVVGFIPPDEKFKKMYSIYKSCQEAHISIPPEVLKFFNNQRPDPSGVEIDLVRNKKAVKEYRDESSQGYEIEIESLPNDIKIIRFTNSW